MLKQSRARFKVVRRGWFGTEQRQKGLKHVGCGPRGSFKLVPESHNADSAFRKHRCTVFASQGCRNDKSLGSERRKQDGGEGIFFVP